MTLTLSIVVYGSVGLSFGVYQWRQQQTPQPQRAIMLGLFVCFWPLLVATLLPPVEHTEGAAKSASTKPAGTHAKAIEQAFRSIADNLSRLQGTPETIISRETERFHALKATLLAMDQRVSELSETLTSPAFSEEALTAKQQTAIDSQQPKAIVDNLQIQINSSRTLRRTRDAYTQHLQEALATLESINAQMTVLRLTGDNLTSTKDSQDQLTSLLFMLDGLQSIQLNEEIEDGNHHANAPGL